MRILHIEDAAAVSCILAKYQHQIQGHTTKVIKPDRLDKFGFYNYYKDYVTTVVSEEQFLINMFEEAKRADIVHIHSRADLVLKLRKKFGQSKKLVLHYHGTDIRGIRKQKLPHRSRLSDAAIRSIFLYRRIKNTLLLKKKIHPKAQNLSNLVIVSTPDLLKNISVHENIRKVYLPNPVDSELFKPDDLITTEKINTTKRDAITMDTEVTDIPYILEHLKKNRINLDVEVHDRIKYPLAYVELPAFLKSYRVYVDLKYINGRIIQALSKTGLEALACGLEVLDYNLKLRRGLPEEHHLSNVIHNLSKEYDLLEK